MLSALIYCSVAPSILGQRLLCVPSYFFRIDSQKSVRTVFKFHDLGEGVGWIKIKGGGCAWGDQWD